MLCNNDPEIVLEIDCRFGYTEQSCESYQSDGGALGTQTGGGGFYKEN